MKISWGKKNVSSSQCLVLAVSAAAVACAPVFSTANPPAQSCQLQPPGAIMSEAKAFSVTTHPSGLECITLQHPSGARATVTLHGANVIEWTAGGTSSASRDENLLFVSEKAVFNGKKAIRGGIPLVFPQFGDGLNGPTGLPAHGFARVSKWSFVSGGLDELSFEATPFAGKAFAVFQLTSEDVYDASHESPWLNGSIDFNLSLRVELAPGYLSTALTITNTRTDRVRPLWYLLLSSPRNLTCIFAVLCFPDDAFVVCLCRKKFCLSNIRPCSTRIITCLTPQKWQCHSLRQVASMATGPLPSTIK